MMVVIDEASAAASAEYFVRARVHEHPRMCVEYFSRVREHPTEYALYTLRRILRQRINRNSEPCRN
jgi:hypothetical protein